MDPLMETLTKWFPCFAHNRNNRVGPEGSVFVGRSTSIPRGADPNVRLRDELNGEINLHFVSDGDDESHVVIECPTICEYPVDPLAAPQLTEIEALARKKRSNSVIDEKSSYNNSNSYLTTLFIETAKRKHLRVVHYREIEDEDEDEEVSDRPASKVRFADSIDSAGTRRKDFSSSGSEDEDEYWFSKWSRRPRLKKQEKKIENNDSNNILGPASNKIPSQEETEENAEENCISFTLPQDMSQENTISNLDVNGSVGDDGVDIGFTNLGFQPDEENDKTGGDENSGTNKSTLEVSRTEVDDADDIADEDSRDYFKLESLDVDSDAVDNEVTEDSPSEASQKPVKPLLFFIHSISGSSDVWKSQIQYFHRLGYEIAALDLLGHGLSGTPPQSKLYHFESLVQDVVTVFDHFVPNEQRQVVVIGHGYGACLATVLTRIRPKNICILVSISGGGPTPMVSSFWCDSPWIPIPCSWIQRRKKQGRFENPEMKHVLPRNIHENLIYGQIWLDGDPAFHRRITVPTLLVYGLKDNVVNLVEVCEMERTIPRAYLELIPTAGHMVMWDEPHKLNRMLRKFIQAQWS